MSRHRQSGGLVLRMRARLLAVVVATLAALVLPIAPAGAAVATAPPRIAGVAAVGQTVSAEPGTWDTQGLTLVHTWLLDGVAVADGPEYTPGPADQGHGLSVRETALQDGAPVGDATSDPVTVLGPAPTSTSAPVITGDNHVGSVLEVSDGAWDAPDLTLSYQWLRAGEPIPGADGQTYTLVGMDWCQPIAVVVTASREGYAHGVAVSDPVPVSCLIVDPIYPPTVVHLLDPVIRPDQRAGVRVRIVSPGSAVPVGRLTFRVDGRWVRAARLEAAQQGRVVVRLPRQHVGAHRVRVRFDPDDGSLFYSSGAVVRLRVRPGHPGP